MHVQTTPVDKNACTKNSTKNKLRFNSRTNICFRVKTLCPEDKNDCIFTVEDFTNLFKSLLQNKTEKNFNCREDILMKCKKNYYICCKEEGLSEPVHQIDKPNS